MALKKPLAIYGGLIKELAAADSIAPTIGGTGLNTYAVGDLLYASATNVLAKLAAGTAGQILMMIGGIPKWVTEIIGEEYSPSASSTITMLNTPLIGHSQLYKNGTRLPSSRYSISGAIITLTDPRNSNDQFESDYKY